MDRYLPAESAASFAEANKSSFIDYTTSLPVTEPFRGIERFGRPVDFQPQRHVILRHLGERPLRILDIACERHPMGLYLASKGHEVTVTDLNDGHLEWQQQAAGSMKLDAAM